MYECTSVVIRDFYAYFKTFSGKKSARPSLLLKIKNCKPVFLDTRKTMKFFFMSFESLLKGLQIGISTHLDAFCNLILCGKTLNRPEHKVPPHFLIHTETENKKFFVLKR